MDKFTSEDAASNKQVTESWAKAEKKFNQWFSEIAAARVTRLAKCWVQTLRLRLGYPPSNGFRVPQPDTNAHG